MENEKKENGYRLKIIDDAIKYGENPFNVIVKLSSDEITVKVEDIRHYYGKIKRGFDYLVEE